MRKACHSFHQQTSVPCSSVCNVEIIWTHIIIWHQLNDCFVQMPFLLTTEPLIAGGSFVDTLLFITASSYLLEMLGTLIRVSPSYCFGVIMELNKLFHPFVCLGATRVTIFHN